MDFTDVKAPEPVNGAPPWRDARWTASADAWIDEACARSGLRRTGPATARCRIYSVVARVPVETGAVWFKASPGQETALLETLALRCPAFFRPPLATDADRSWSLLADGGETMRDRQQRAPDPHAWSVALTRYAGIQQTMAGHVPELIARGVPDLRPGSVPDQFERLLRAPETESCVGAEGGVSRAAYAELLALVPRLAQWCAELSELGIPDSLDHADVHLGNMFAAAGVPFDWGDAVVTHPFCSLWVALRQAARAEGVTPRSARVGSLASSYFLPWETAGYSRNVIDRSLDLALRVAPLTQALAWTRVWPCFAGHPATTTAAARTLTAMLLDDPLEFAA